jgi:hypothetical protein
MKQVREQSVPGGIRTEEEKFKTAFDIKTESVDAGSWN